MNEEPYTLLERAQNREHKKTRELVVEWWEVWNMKSPDHPYFLVPEQVPTNLKIPSHGFETHAEALDFLGTRGECGYQEAHLKIKHVRRTRKTKK